MLIAIVEDEADVARLYRAILEDAGHQVLQVDQHDLAQIGDAEVVVFDVMMPDVDGVQVVEWLTVHLPHVRKVAATAVYHVPSRVRELADVVLAKPFKPAELLEAVDRR